MAKQMTRQEHLDHGLISVNGMMMSGAQYRAYHRLGYAGDLPSWEEIQLEAKPYLATDELFEEHRRKMGWSDPQIDA